MDSAWLAVAVMTLAGMGVLAPVLWWMQRRDERRERTAYASVRGEVGRWCAASGWTPGMGLSVAAGSPFDPFRRERDHELVGTARGELAGHPAELLVGARDDGDGAPACTVAVIRGPDGWPPLEVWQRYVVATLWKAQDPAPPDPSAGDTVFHRQLKLGPRTGADGRAVLGPEVRAALLRLHGQGVFKQQFVDVRDGHLQVLVSRWPPALDLDLFVADVGMLVRALTQAVERP